MNQHQRSPSSVSNIYKINLPLSVKVSAKKNFLLNLNSYRNAHYFTLNNAKQLFKNQIESELDKLPRFNKIKLTYVLFNRTTHLSDVSNICSVVDKFFCDALVEANKLEDDNHTLLPIVEYRYGEYDKLNGRVEVYIEELEPELDKMIITIAQNEIETAIKNYIMSQVNIRDDMDINIDLKATRGTDGYSATIEIVPTGESVKNVDPDPEPVKRKYTKSSPEKEKTLDSTDVFDTPEEYSEDPKNDTDVSPSENEPINEEEKPSGLSLFGRVKR